MKFEFGKNSVETHELKVAKMKDTIRVNDASVYSRDEGREVITIVSGDDIGETDSFCVVWLCSSYGAFTAGQFFSKEYMAEMLVHDGWTHQPNATLKLERE